MTDKIGGKKGEVFNEGVLSQFKITPNGFKIVTHLDKLPNPYSNDTHVEDHFDRDGNYLGNLFNIKSKK